MTISHMFSQLFVTVKEYLLTVLKWFIFSIIVGTVCGLGGVLFHYAVDEATILREHYQFILYLLPVAGLIIVFFYHIFKLDNDKGTNSVFLAVREKGSVSPFLAPLILIGTTLTHLCGGSAGREGAALQIGGGLASLIAKVFKLKEKNTSVLIMCGMAAVFSAVFGTPLTATIFTLEVISVGLMHYSIFLPVLLSSVISFFVATSFGIAPTKFTLLATPSFDGQVFLKVILLSALAGLLSIVFIFLMHESTKLCKKHLKNKYLAIVLGAILVILLTKGVGTFDYNGAGMHVIKNALETGVASPFAPFLKILFTVITLSVGFKGGEIVPSFFIGSTFGVLFSALIGLNPSFAASIGLIAFFCGVCNTPLATIILSVELFGSEGILYYAVAVAVSYIISGNHSLYSSQKIMYSKLHSCNLEDLNQKGENI